MPRKVPTRLDGEVKSMMTKAFILIETMRGKSKEINAALRQLEGVISVDPVTAPYDFIAIAEGDSLTDIGYMVNLKIKSIDGVSRAVTCTMM
jgi:DNA-binding Lrp family transcriptional regulator